MATGSSAQRGGRGPRLQLAAGHCWARAVLAWQQVAAPPAGRPARAGARRRGRALEGAGRAAGAAGRGGTGHARADRPSRPEAPRRGERGRGGWNVFPLWRTNNTGQRGGQALRPFNRVGGLVLKGGSGGGNSCSFNSLPSSSSQSACRGRRARSLEHSARAAPAPPSRRPRGASPARAPRAPPRLRAARARPKCGGAGGPGGVGEVGGQKNSTRTRAR